MSSERTSGRASAPRSQRYQRSTGSDASGDLGRDSAAEYSHYNSKGADAPLIPIRSLRELILMNIAFIGIQFGWSLQMANMSPIYEILGADPDEIPLLWLGAPLTGLIVQPIVGHASDHTRSRLGRRRPFFIGGTCLAVPCLVLMPFARRLWQATALLWVLDASNNVAMEPMRALVADLTPFEQRNAGYAVQTTCIGVGAVLASIFPYLMRALGVSGGDGVGTDVVVSFLVGAAVYAACVAVTCFSVHEKPSDQPRVRFARVLREMGARFAHMPPAMRRLGAVHFFSWMAMFTFNLYFSVFVASDIFGGDAAAAEGSAARQAYSEGQAFAGLLLAFYNFVTMAVSLALPRLMARAGRCWVWFACLLCGAAALVLVLPVPTAGTGGEYVLFLNMLLMGVLWAGMLTVPYAILADVLKTESSASVGFYMGVFNIFITLPEIIASVGYGPLVKHVFDGSSRVALAFGGCIYLIAAGLVFQVKDPSGNTMFKRCGAHNQLVEDAVAPALLDL